MAKRKRSGKARAGRLAASVEIEQKFEVPDGFVIPDLSALALGTNGVVAVDEPVVHELAATYVDTVDLDLLARRWVLRRRTGGTDAGWHLKRPSADGARDELSHPAGRSATVVPAAVQREVAVFVRGKKLQPIARLSSRRTVVSLRDAEGEAAAEVMIDDVDAVAFGADGAELGTSRWRELEVELGSGDADLLLSVVKAVRAAGATPSASPSKLDQALRPRLNGTHPEPPAVPHDLGPSHAVGVVLAYLAQEVMHLQEQDPRVRQDAPDAVHQMRVASRRLRSALATYRELFDREVTEPIRTELQWLGVELGAARDVEVVRDHLIGEVAAEPAALRHGPVVKRIGSAMAARYKAAHVRGVAAMTSPRYYALLDALDALVGRPPLAEDAAGKPVEALTGLTRRTWRRIKRQHAELAALAPSAVHERDLVLHEIRKSAKRARYAGEAMTATFGGPARRYAEAMAAIQQALGDHQDSVVVREVLLWLAEEAAAAGEPTFTYGRLHALEQARGQATETEFDRAWERASATSLRAWLR